MKEMRLTMCPVDSYTNSEEFRIANIFGTEECHPFISELKFMDIFLYFQFLIISLQPHGWMK